MRQSDVVSSAALQLLFVLRGANMQLTSDQAMQRVFSGSSYKITDITAVMKTGGATVACVGGIYTAAGKTGAALVAAAQSWLGLSAAGKTVTPTIAAVSLTDLQTATPILSLTTGSTAACTADIFIFGYVLD